MKKLFPILCLSFSFLNLSAQINTISTNNKSITILPKGIIDDRALGTPNNNFIALGDSALLTYGSNPNNISNIAIGPKAMAKAVNLGYNIAIGENSMYKATGGYTNVAVGRSTLTQNSGFSNTAIGDYAMIDNLTGFSNTAIGSNAFAKNNNGRNNVALGSGSLSNAKTVANVIAIGSGALNGLNYNNIANSIIPTEINNISIGNSSSLKLQYVPGPSNGNGGSNVIIGNNSLSNALSGSENTSLGHATLLNITESNYNTAIGAICLYALKNNGAILSERNSGTGHYALSELVYGSGNVGFGVASGNSLKFGDNNSFLGISSGVDFLVTNNLISNSMALGYNAKVNTSNKVVIGNSSVATIGGFATWSNYSDRRLKENIEYTDKLGLTFINQLKTASYNYITDANKRRRDGLIAQDVQATLKELGINFSGLIEDNDPSKTLNISYTELVLPLINAVKELSAENSILKSDVKDLKKDMVELKAMIEKSAIIKAQ